MSLKKEPTKVIRIPARFELEIKEYIKILLLNPSESLPEHSNPSESLPEHSNPSESLPEHSRAYLDLALFKSLSVVDVSSKSSHRMAFIHGIASDNPIRKFKSKRKEKKCSKKN